MASRATARPARCISVWAGKCAQAQTSNARVASLRKSLWVAAEKVPASLEMQLELVSFSYACQTDVHARCE
jgi:hypothetical protein